MNREIPIPLFHLYPTDSTRLLVLKSKFNRHAIRLNSLHGYLGDHEKDHLHTVLAYLHLQIQAYKGQLKE